MTRFVILGHPRCGSFLLLHALNQHPRVQCFAELFLRYQPSRAKFHALDDERFYRDGEDGAAFLRDAVYRPRGERDVVGFKLFYEQAPSPPASSAWAELAATRDLRVIHLQRENLLESLISLRIAQATDDWQLHRVERRAPRSLPPFALAPDDCARYFDAVEADRRRALERLSGQPRLELEYRELCARFAETMNACFRQLGVEPRPVEMTTLKQATRPAHEQLLNYDELQRRFAGTRHARYFRGA